MSDAATILGQAGSVDVGGIRALAARVGQVGDDVQAIRDRLRSRTDTTWTGTAATTFRATLATVDPDLARLATSHDGARRALNSYAATLEDLQHRAGDLAGRADAARRDKAAAEDDHRGAQTALARAQAAAATAHDPAAQTAANRAVRSAAARAQAAESRGHTAAGDLDRMDRAADGLRDELAAAERACAGALDDAAHSGLYRSSFAQAMSRIGHALAPVGQTLSFSGGLVAKTFVDAVLLPEDLGTAAGDFFAGHGNLEDARQVLEDVGAIVTIVAVGAAVVGTGGAAAAVGLGALGLGVGGARFGVDAALVSEGRLSRDQLLVDGAGLALGAAGVGAGLGAGSGSLLERDVVTSLTADRVLGTTEALTEPTDEELASRLVTPTDDSPWDQARDRLSRALRPEAARSY